MSGPCPTSSSRSTDLGQKRYEEVKHISTQCQRHRAQQWAALMSCTGLVHAAEQTGPELAFSSQGQVTFSQTSFEKMWVGKTSLYQFRAPQPGEGD